MALTPCLQVCSALICVTALGEVFEKRGHDHESNILKLKPGDSSGGGLGDHAGHAHMQNNRGGRRGKGEDHDHGEEENHTGLDHEDEEREDGHEHHRDAGGNPEEVTLRKASADNEHDNHMEHMEHMEHSISTNVHDTVQQRLESNEHDHKPSLENKHDHEYEESKHDKHEYEEKQEKAKIMSEPVALKKGLGGIHRYCLFVYALQSDFIYQLSPTKNT